MALLTMPDGTTFASNTLDTLAQQWAAWVHGQGWETLSEAQQKAATSECATRLRQLLGVEVAESAAVLARAAVCRGPGLLRSPSTSNLMSDVRPAWMHVPRVDRYREQGAPHECHRDQRRFSPLTK